jgi:formylglycine-generating enzyme required for sulfatase activity
MIRIPGGTFRMGSDRHYPEEAPSHRVTVDPFWIDAMPVTNAQFRAFVQATGYVSRWWRFTFGATWQVHDTRLLPFGMVAISHLVMITALPLLPLVFSVLSLDSIIVRPFKILI